MSELKQAARQALDALEEVFDRGQCELTYLQGKRAITALRAALAQQAEPVSMDKIKNTHTKITRFDFEQRPDHEYAGLPHRLYTQSSTDGCYLCACLAEIDRLKQQAEPVVDREAISRALGGDSYWMNPPDGGSVTLFEQVARANKAGREREKYVAILVRAYDAIEALDGTSLENEKLVDDYRAALTQVATSNVNIVSELDLLLQSQVATQQAEPVAATHKLATSGDDGQSMTQAASGNPSY